MINRPPFLFIYLFFPNWWSIISRFWRPCLGRRVDHDEAHRLFFFLFFWEGDATWLTRTICRNTPSLTLPCHLFPQEVSCEIRQIYRWRVSMFRVHSGTSDQCLIGLEDIIGIKVRCASHIGWSNVKSRRTFVCKLINYILTSAPTSLNSNRPPFQLHCGSLKPQQAHRSYSLQHKWRSHRGSILCFKISLILYGISESLGAWIAGWVVKYNAPIH